MTRLLDLTGHRFARLTVLSRGPNAPSGKVRWVCRCDCGEESLVHGQDLRSGNSQSCACLQQSLVVAYNDALRLDLVGQRFARLLVVARASNTPTGKTQWQCQCDCGNATIAYGDHLKRGTTRSCGCLATESIGNVNKSHGASKAPVYAVWEAMRARCRNPHNKDYAAYGGRGIAVCESWQVSFEAFLADMGMPGEGMTLERLDNNLGYTPENCCWTTRLAQAQNQRTNRLVDYHGELLPISEVARRVGHSRSWVQTRVAKGLLLP